MVHRHLLHNGQIIDASSRTLAAGQVGLLNGWGVFSTIRVFDGILFAWERHWARMQRDARLLHVPFPEDPQALHADLVHLVKANQAENSTLRVAVIRNRGGSFEGPGIDRDFDVVAFTTEVKHWGRGVRLAVQPQARHSACPFAGAKILSWSFNLTWLETAQQRGFDEVILLNEFGQVSECTSANIFLEKAGLVYTPPLSSGCLPGITRELLLGEARPPGLSILEQPLTLVQVLEADSVFITSTTRELLPVLCIEDKETGTNDPCRLIMQQAFERYCDHYVAAMKRRAA